MTADGELPLVRRSGKSESAFRTISEVADELDVPQHVLRFWESKFPQVKPLKRGGGRRYYRPEDVALLRRIRDLLYSEGYTIKGVQKLLREGGVRDAVAATVRTAEVELPLGHDPEDVSEPEPMPDPENAAGDDSDMDDGEVSPVSVEVMENVVQPVPASGFSSKTRRELQALLGELEHLRGLLQPR